MINETMIVTGTSRGVGRQIAESYLSAGWQVLGCSRSSSGVINHPSYEHFLIDLCDQNSIQNIFKIIRKEYKVIHVLINNAAISNEKYVMSLQSDEIEKMFQVNTQASILIAKEVHRIMRKSKFGRIINISSLHSKICCPGASIYGATKAALEQFSRVMAKEVIVDGVTVNNLSLSVVEESGMLNNMSTEVIETILGLTITEQKLGITDIKHALDFLISENSKLITGETLHIGGI